MMKQKFCFLLKLKLQKGPGSISQSETSKTYGMPGSAKSTNKTQNLKISKVQNFVRDRKFGRCLLIISHYPGHQGTGKTPSDASNLTYKNIYLLENLLKK